MSRFQRHVRETTIVDGEVKEIKEKSTGFSRDTKTFTQQFDQDVMRVLGLKGSQLKLLIIMTTNMDYENKVRITGPDRKQWAEDIGISHQTLNLALSELMAKACVLRKGQGMYVVDPELFNRGTLKEVDDKVKTFNASFDISYEMTNKGIKRRVKILRDDVKEDDDGEVY